MVFIKIAIPDKLEKGHSMGPIFDLLLESLSLDPKHALSSTHQRSLCQICVYLIKKKSIITKQLT